MVSVNTLQETTDCVSKRLECRVCLSLFSSSFFFLHFSLPNIFNISPLRRRKSVILKENTFGGIFIPCQEDFLHSLFDSDKQQVERRKVKTVREREDKDEGEREKRGSERKRRERVEMMTSKYTVDRESIHN